MKKLWMLLSIIALTACSGGGPGPTPSTTYSVSGTTVAGTAVNASGQASANTVADANGNYSLTLSDGNYTVTPSLPGSTFSPTSITVRIIGADYPRVDFAATVSSVIAPTCPANTSLGGSSYYCQGVSNINSEVVTISCDATGKLIVNRIRGNMSYCTGSPTFVSKDMSSNMWASDVGLDSASSLSCSGTSCTVGAGSLLEFTFTIPGEQTATN